MSTGIIIFGSVLSATANQTASKTLTFDDVIGLFDTVCIVYSIICFFGVIGSALWLERQVRAGESSWTSAARVTLSILAPALGGTMNGFVGYSVKALSTTVAATTSTSAIFSHGPVWVYVILVLIAILAQVRYLNTGLAYFSAQRTVPVFQCAIIVSNSLAGIIYFGDMRETPVQIGIFFLGAAIASGGILLLLLQKEGGSASGKPIIKKETDSLLKAIEKGRLEWHGVDDTTTRINTTSTAPASASDIPLTSTGTTAVEEVSPLSAPTPWYLEEFIPLLKHTIHSIFLRFSTHTRANTNTNTNRSSSNGNNGGGSSPFHSLDV